MVDHERQLVYIWTYPDAHFVIFNLEIRAPMDKGPVVKGVYYVQPWIGPDKNVYLVDTPSRVVRYHPDANTMEDLSPEGAEGLKWMRALAQSPDRAKVYGYAAEGDEIWLVELNLAGRAERHHQAPCARSQGQPAAHGLRPGRHSLDHAAPERDRGRHQPPVALRRRERRVEGPRKGRP